MLTATQQALATPDILTTILEHLYSARLHFKDSNYLSPACLVAQAWRKPAQELLHWRIAFHRGTAQLKQWLAAIGDEKESKFVTWEIVIEDSEQVVEGEGWDLEVVKEVLGKVKGVTSLALAMMREREIPTEWIMGKNLKSTLILPPSLTDQKRLLIKHIDVHRRCPFSSRMSSLHEHANSSFQPCVNRTLRPSPSPWSRLGKHLQDPRSST